MLAFPCTTLMDFFVNNRTSYSRKIWNCLIFKDNLILSLIVSLFCLTDHNQTPLVGFQYLRSCAKNFLISFSGRNHVKDSMISSSSSDFFAWVTLLDLVKRSGQLNMAIETQQTFARFLYCIIQLLQHLSPWSVSLSSASNIYLFSVFTGLTNCESVAIL